MRNQDAEQFDLSLSCCLNHQVCYGFVTVTLPKKFQCALVTEKSVTCERVKRHCSRGRACKWYDQRALFSKYQHPWLKSNCNTEPASVGHWEG